MEVGYALISLVDERQGGTLLQRVKSIRRQIATETGMIVPPVHVADNLQLGPRTYALLVKGVEVARAELMPDRLLAINPGTATGTIEGTTAREPAFGLPALWVRAEQRDAATAAGFTVVDPTTALSTHLSEIIRNFLPDLLTRQHTKEMVDRVAQQSPRLVDDLVPKLLGLGEIQRVLRQLLRERVPVKDLTTILEALADVAGQTKDADQLNEAVRQALGRAICRQHQTEQGDLPTINLAPSLEERLMQAIVRTEHGVVLAHRSERRPEHGVAHRAGPRDGGGTACAFVFASTASSPVAIVHPGAAADGGPFAQRDPHTREGCTGCRT